MYVRNIIYISKGGVYMEIIKNNKELLMFYVFIVLFALFMVNNVNINNDRVMLSKNPYILSNN